MEKLECTHQHRGGIDRLHGARVAQLEQEDVFQMEIAPARFGTPLATAYVPKIIRLVGLLIRKHNLFFIHYLSAADRSERILSLTR